MDTLNAPLTEAEEFGHLGRAAQLADEIAIGMHDDILHLVCKDVKASCKGVNAECKKFSTPRERLEPSVETQSDQMHQSMKRLLDFAREATKGQPNEVRSTTDLREPLGITSQVLTNWMSRGISKEGALEAERQFGCYATWLLGLRPTPVPQATEAAPALELREALLLDRFRILARRPEAQEAILSEALRLAQGGAVTPQELAATARAIATLDPVARERILRLTEGRVLAELDRPQEPDDGSPNAPQTPAKRTRRAPNQH
jgi:hypothetical protein